MSNPTTKSTRDPAIHADAQLELVISYNPIEGTLRIGGNVNDALVFYGMLKLAEKTWDRKQDNARIKLATAGGN